MTSEHNFLLSKRSIALPANKKTTAIALAIFLLFASLAVWHNHHPAPQGQPVSWPQTAFQGKITLLPLDGRPPCRQFVISGGRIAGLEVSVPPSELQDYYSLPGNTQGMREWLMADLSGASAAIISIDQLLHGGLLAAREKNADHQAVDSLIAYLKNLHEIYPQVPLYAFSILPRLTPQDSIDGYQERKDLVAYSRLVGKQAAGLDVDEAELARLKEAIPPQSLATYLQHFQENEYLNQKLIDLTKEGVLAQLVLGQDDGEAYSIPNIEKSALMGYIERSGLDSSRVFLTHGADEIALTLLGEINNKKTGCRTKVYIDSNSPAAAKKIMPYMAVDMETTAREKIALLGAEEAASPTEAELILFLSAMDNEEDTLQSRSPSLKKLKEYQAQGKAIALVDLSQHFAASECLLPYLIEEDFPVSSLAAYSGWNTASNAIGTALSEALLWQSSLSACRDEYDAVSAAYAQSAFLQGRIMEDYYYLKQDIDEVNNSLKKAGYLNTADLDLEHNYRYATALLQKSMQEHLELYRNTFSARTPFLVKWKQGELRLALHNLRLDISFPWPRTFEVNLMAYPELYREP